MGARRESIALREVLVAAMRDAPEPLSTDQLRAIVVRKPTPGISGVAYYQVYPQLRALERVGVCQRVYVADSRCVFWRYTQDEAFAAVVDALEPDTVPAMTTTPESASDAPMGFRLLAVPDPLWDDLTAWLRSREFLVGAGPVGDDGDPTYIISPTDARMSWPT